jgi:hypothetical protein
LVGARIGVGGNSTMHSFWANSPSDERAMWTSFLHALSGVEKPTLVHYGSFEAKFLRKMCARYGPPPPGSNSADAIAAPLNLLSLIFAKVYFPSYSNGLKENARHLGFEWTDASANGLQAIVWRNLWEESHDPEVQDKLITYNRDDCTALNVVSCVLGQLTDVVTPNGVHSFQTEVVHVDAIRPQASNWRPFKSPIADLERINRAARWDYQRDRVFIRSETTRMRSARQSTRRQRRRKLKR